MTPAHLSDGECYSPLHPNLFPPPLFPSLPPPPFSSLGESVCAPVLSILRCRTAYGRKEVTRALPSFGVFGDPAGSCASPRSRRGMGAAAMTDILSLGAGVQSSTLALMAKHGELPGYHVDAAIFADTQDEPTSVYRWLEWLKKQLPFPVHVVTAGSLSEATLRKRTSRKTGKDYMKRFIPGFANIAGKPRLLPRKCTFDFKLVPIRKAKRKIAAVPRGCKKVLVRTLIGISIDEAHRMKPSGEPWSVNCYPLVEFKMSRTDCFRWMEKRGYPQPPRSACVYCPFHSDKEWMRLKNDEPEAFRKAVEFERAFQANRHNQGLEHKEYLHSSLVPLDQVKFRHERQTNLFGNECEGMCGV